jgi:hypothetical protein
MRHAAAGMAIGMQARIIHGCFVNNPGWERWIVGAMTISWLAFACVFGGALLGMFIRTVVPEHHLGPDSKDIVRLGMGLIATMAALLLGLLVSTTKGSYDTQKAELTDMSAKIIVLDRLLAHYGSETREARDLLRRVVVRALNQTWPEQSSRSAQPEPTTARAEAVYDSIQALAPQNDAQRSLQAQALGVITGLDQLRWLMFEQSSSSISMPFLVVVVFWLTIIFVSFGLYGPPNATVIVTLLLCALSVSGALFLILELDQPFDGMIQIPSAPLRNALAHLGQ